MTDKTPFEQSRENEQFAKATDLLVSQLRYRMQARGYEVRSNIVVLHRTEVEKDGQTVATYVWNKDFIIQTKDGVETKISMALDTIGGLVVGGASALDAVTDAIVAALP